MHLLIENCFSLSIHCESGKKNTVASTKGKSMMLIPMSMLTLCVWDSRLEKKHCWEILNIMSMKSRLFPRSALLFFLFEHIYNGPGTDFADETAEAIHHMNICLIKQMTLNLTLMLWPGQNTRQWRHGCVHQYRSAECSGSPGSNASTLRLRRLISIRPMWTMLNRAVMIKRHTARSTPIRTLTGNSR